MKNLDLIQQKKAEIAAQMNQAVKDGDEEAFAQAFTDFTDMIQQAVLAEAQGMVAEADKKVLAGRGVRQLTSEESTYYQKVIDAMRGSNPKQALTDLDVVMPKTVIDAVFEDLTEEHPLLDAISFQNTSGLIEYFVNTHENQLATWAALTAEVVKELTSGFKKIDMDHDKLSAFLPVAKAMLDLGPTWLDRYVRAVLGDAASFGLEEGIINGTGNNMPIGMDRQVGEGVTVTDGVYPLKDTVVITKLNPVTYGSLISSLATNAANEKNRIIKEVLLIVNPADYLNKIMPATTIRAVDGTYVNNVFPFPTKVIQSVQVESGKAIIGLGKRYFMGLGTAKSGKIEYSDEYRFLEDERVYLVKLYGHGEPLDNNAFIYLDISGLEPAVHEVYVSDGELAVNNLAELTADASLSALTIGALTLDPTFDSDTFVYEVATTNATNAVAATATDTNATLVIKVNGTLIDNGDAPTWDTGANNVVISVYNGAAVKTYVVIVTKSE